VQGLFPRATLRLSSITSIAAREARIKSPEDDNDDGDAHDIDVFLMIKVVTMMMIITISV
jgi:hypothetical protein